MDQTARPEFMASQDLSALLQRARRQALHDASGADLRKLVVALEAACEFARVAALRNLLHPGLQTEHGDRADRNCGFAALFALLRRARLEVRRRDSVLPQTAAGLTQRKHNPSQRALIAPTAIGQPGLRS
ncbi:MAG: hypothetical protein ACK4RN_07185 [Pseudorhodobacter sp.]